MINGISDHRLEEIELRLVGCDHRPWAMSSLDYLDDEGRQTIIKGSRKASKKAEKRSVQAAREMIKKGKDENGWDPQESVVIKQWEKDGERMAHGPTLRKALTLFRRTDSATNDMLEFVVHAPQDVEDLLREIKQLRIMCTKLKEERHDAVQELQGTKVAASRAEEKIADMRRAWRSLVKEMGTRP